MKKVRRILTMGLATIAAVSVMSMSAFADEINSTYEIPSQAVDYTNNSLEYIGHMLVVYHDNEVHDMIPIDNEDNMLSVEIEEGTVNLTSENGVLVQSIELSDEDIETEAIVSAKALFVYKVTANDVCLRASFPDGAVVDYLQKGMLFGSQSFSASGWLYGYVVDDLDYYSYSIDGWWGYVWSGYLVHA